MTANETPMGASLSETEREFLDFALDLAAGRMAERPSEFGDDDRAALAALRRLAGKTPQQPILWEAK